MLRISGNQRCGHGMAGFHSGRCGSDLLNDASFACSIYFVHRRGFLGALSFRILLKSHFGVMASILPPEVELGYFASIALTTS
jgi:hypothetical protein